MKSSWVSNLPECNKSESGQTLNTRARQLFRRSVEGGRGQVVSVECSQCCDQAAERGTGPAGSELRLRCSVRGPLVLISTEIADTRNHGEQQVTGNWGDWRLEKRSKYHMTQQTDLICSFRIVQGMSRWHIGQIKGYDWRDYHQLFLDSSLLLLISERFNFLWFKWDSRLMGISDGDMRMRPGPWARTGRICLKTRWAGPGPVSRPAPCAEPGAVTLHEAATLVVCGRSVSRPAQSEPRALSGKIAAWQKKYFSLKTVAKSSAEEILQLYNLQIKWDKKQSQTI